MQKEEQCLSRGTMRDNISNLQKARAARASALTQHGAGRLGPTIKAACLALALFDVVHERPISTN